MKNISCKNNLISIPVIIIILLISFSGNAQQLVLLPQSGNAYVPLDGFSNHLVDRMDIQYDLSYQYLHTAVKPYLREQVAQLNQAYKTSDSLTLYDQFNVNYLCVDNPEFCKCSDKNYFNGNLFKFLYPEPSVFYQFFTVQINPVIHTEFGFTSDTSNLKFVNTRGIELRGSVDNKVGFYFYATDNQAAFPQYVQDRIDASSRVVPGEGTSKLFKTEGVDYLSAHGYFTFNATKNIAFQFGQDKIFIGDGIRSMIWSNNSKDQLFLKINTKIWRVNYMNYFTELANYDGSNIYNSLVHKKYAAMHHLSIPITKKLNIGLFESVIFDRTGLYGAEKGFELNYLNPVIFYRAVESGLGSSDNVLLGMNWKWNFLHSFSFYGQFVLDELVFDELISGDGWWGNKYAAQAGLKYINAFTMPHFDIQVEHNMARPYTYSYEDENGSSYTHYGQAIAHPLGANFKENIVSLWYQPAGRFTISNNFIYSTFGSDTSGSNWGGDIFLDYNSYEQEFGNSVGQGVENNLMLNDLILSWQAWHNIFIDGRFTFRKLDSELDIMDSKQMYFSIGVRANEVLKYFYF
ncbi:MAG: hypothetical protein ACHQFW_00955 [Chitinophagales bacterium]